MATSFFRPRPKLRSTTIAQPTLILIRCSRSSATCPLRPYHWKNKNKTHMHSVRDRLSDSQDQPPLLFVLLPLCPFQWISKERLAFTNVQKTQGREEQWYFDDEVPDAFRADSRLFRRGCSRDATNHQVDRKLSRAIK